MAVQGDKYADKTKNNRQIESIRKQKIELNRAKDLADIALIDGFIDT